MGCARFSLDAHQESNESLFEKSMNTNASLISKKEKEKDPLRPPLMARCVIAFTCSSEAQEYRERWRARRHGWRGHRLLEEVGRLAGAL